MLSFFPPLNSSAMEKTKQIPTDKPSTSQTYMDLLKRDSTSEHYEDLNDGMLLIILKYVISGHQTGDVMRIYVGQS